jgi:hypothetical protein
MEHVILPPDYRGRIAWDPCAGEGHMSGVLTEYFESVYASDVHDYGKGFELGSFVGEGPDVAPAREVDWIVMNPPFNLAMPFVLRALDIARRGVAVLVRTAWLEGGDRYRSLFCMHPPSKIAVFAERVPMVKGRWDPNASTATSYSWLAWRKGPPLPFAPQFTWIPPGCRTALARVDDVERFASPPEAEVSQRTYAVFRQERFVGWCDGASATEAIDRWIDTPLSNGVSPRSMPGPWMGIEKSEAIARGMIK